MLRRIVTAKYITMSNVSPVEYRPYSDQRSARFNCPRVLRAAMSPSPGGGIRDSIPQERVADALEHDFPPDDAPLHDRPAFFYALGDCVYFNGEASQYYLQFYHPYEHYPAAVVAVAGNHDGDNVGHETSLEAFVRNLCAPEPGLHSPDAGDSVRTRMTQPNVYWTLVSDLINIVGLYSNVPSGGRLTDPQRKWLVHELKTLPKRVPIVVTLHHPPFSADTSHGGSDRMRQEIDTAAKAAGRIPDLVFAGHVHAYERFTRRRSNGDEYPYIVAGAGGYHNLHPIARPRGRALMLPTAVKVGGDMVSLENYKDDRHGFLRMEVTKDAIVGNYFTVPRPHESWSQGARLFEIWRYDLRARKVSRGS